MCSSSRGRAEPLDEQRKGVILMRERTQNRFLDPSQQRREGRITMQVGTQDDGVGDVADQTLHPDPIAACEW